MSKRQQIWQSLSDQEYRRAYAADIGTGLAFQIRLIRRKRGWTQTQLAQRMGTSRVMISRWENPNHLKYRLETVIALAAAFDVAPIIRFGAFSELVSWSAALTPERLAPASYEEEQTVRENLDVH